MSAPTLKPFQPWKEREAGTRIPVQVIAESMVARLVDYNLVWIEESYRQQALTMLEERDGVRGAE